jgi:diguanylate cyclase
MPFPSVEASQAPQRHRLKRTLLAFAFYSLCAAIIGFAAWQGLYPVFPLLAYSVGFIVVSAVFFAAIASGWNLRFQDPSLTQAQIACSAVLCSYTMIYAGQLRGVFMFAYVIGLMFGGTQLTMRQLIALAMVPVTLYPAAAFLASRYDPAGVDWRVEFVHWVSLCVILSFTAMLVGNLTRLRARLRATNADLEAALERLTDMAVHDELTGLYNRRYLLDMLQREKSRTDRSEDSFCVCIIDIDHFKRINDTYGHSEGDAVLRIFAGVAGKFIRSADLLGRWGGEEFLLLLPQTSAHLAETCLQRIKIALEHTGFDGLEDTRITFSGGIAQYRKGEAVNQLIERADRAMYAAKKAGRNRILKDAA